MSSPFRSGVAPTLLSPTSMRMYVQPSVQAGDVQNAATSAAERPFASYPAIAAGTAVVGGAYLLRLVGTYGTRGVLPPTQTCRLRAGVTGPVLANTGPQSSLLLGAIRARWWAEVLLTVRDIGQQGKLEVTSRVSWATGLGTTVEQLAGPSGTASDDGNPVTIDLTQDVPLVPTWECGAAGNALDAASLRQYIAHVLRPTPT